MSKKKLSIKIPAIILAVLIAFGAIGTVVMTSFKAGAETVTIGMYPQDEVTDSGLLAELRAYTSGDWKPMSLINNTWFMVDGEIKPVGAFDGGTKDYRYMDVKHNGDMYRAIHINALRPYEVGYEGGDNAHSYVDDYGYAVGQTYWFKFAPVSADKVGNTYVSAKIIDAAYWATEIGTDYAGSNYKAVLNNIEKNNIDATELEGLKKFDGDRIVPVSDTVAQEFADNDARKAVVTDYAKIMGVYTDSSKTYGDSACSEGDSGVSGIRYDGEYLPTYGGSTSSYGVRFAFEICEHENETVENAVDALCDTEGYTGDKVCADCGQLLESGSVIPALEHKTGDFWAFENDSVKTNEDHTEATLVQKCSLCGEERTFTVTTGPTEGPRLEIIEDKKCEEEGTVTYHAFFEYETNWVEHTIETFEDSEISPIEAAGHIWGTPEFVWNEEAKTAVAHVVCERDNTHTDDIPAVVTKENSNNGDCTTDEVADYKAVVTVDGNEYSDTKTITTPAAGHTFGEPVWSWNEDYTEASAKFTCTKCGAEEIVKNNTPVKNVVTPACEEAGKTEYTATVLFKEKEYTNTATVTGEAAIGHDWYQQEWSWKTETDGTMTASVTLTCRNDKTHTRTETAVVTKAEPVKISDCETDDVYTAAVTVDGNEIKDTKTVRNYKHVDADADGICDICKNKIGEEPIDKPTDPIVTEYIAKFIVNDKVISEKKYKEGDKIEIPANPVKDGYTFRMWAPEVPEKMPAKDVSFAAAFTKNDSPVNTDKPKDIIPVIDNNKNKDKPDDVTPAPANNADNNTNNQTPAVVQYDDDTPDKAIKYADTDVAAPATGSAPAASIAIFGIISGAAAFAYVFGKKRKD